MLPRGNLSPYAAAHGRASRFLVYLCASVAWLRQGRHRRRRRVVRSILARYLALAGAPPQLPDCLPLATTKAGKATGNSYVSASTIMDERKAKVLSAEEPRAAPFGT